MNKDVIAGNWKQLRGEVRSRWGELTDDELDRAQGSLEKLAGVVQERYGLAKDKVREELDRLLHRVETTGALARERMESEEREERDARAAAAERADRELRRGTLESEPAGRS